MRWISIVRNITIIKWPIEVCSFTSRIIIKCNVHIWVNDKAKVSLTVIFNITNKYISAELIETSSTSSGIWTTNIYTSCIYSIFCISVFCHWCIIRYSVTKCPANFIVITFWHIVEIYCSAINKECKICSTDVNKICRITNYNFLTLIIEASSSRIINC